MGLDETNCRILNLLQEDCRMSLTEIAKRVNLSVDSVRKRVANLKAKRIFYPRIILRPRGFGFSNVVDVKINFSNYDEQKIREFADYVFNHPRVTEAFYISGEWDFTLVIIAKDNEDLAFLTDKIRMKFKSIIKDWSESLTTIALKFESYDMLELMGYKPEINKHKLEKNV